MPHNMITIASPPQEMIDQITDIASHGGGSSGVLKDLRLVGRPFCCSATRLLFQAVRLFQKHASDLDLDKRDDLQALLELAQSGASRYIRVMRVHGDIFSNSSDLTEGVDVTGTIAKAFRDYERPRLERLELFEPNNLMLREFSHPAVAPTIAGLQYLTIWGCPRCPSSAEMRRILQSGESLRSVEWRNCPSSFEGATGIVHPKAPLEHFILYCYKPLVISLDALSSTVRNARNTLICLSIYPMRSQSEGHAQKLTGELTSCPLLHHVDLGIYSEDPVIQQHTERVKSTIPPGELCSEERYPDYWPRLSLVRYLDWDYQEARGYSGPEADILRNLINQGLSHGVKSGAYLISRLVEELAGSAIESIKDSEIYKSISWISSPATAIMTMRLLGISIS
ncbi:hypothetical protein ABOM_008656 [Aspergillus bombycis]|uniref:Uncharacterized protein n=1 Tax=Aspergillus bombycis TaxID=109264 RepID=A0A1F7ZV02_9EURO|nr:hypothetical protein ABOM_008656 [Aspergillus bombycis]OGM43281.1 hypothetical protein ABOM_008656 [Aspergillus bombycis]